MLTPTTYELYDYMEFHQEFVRLSSEKLWELFREYAFGYDYSNGSIAGIYPRESLESYREDDPNFDPDLSKQFDRIYEVLDLLGLPEEFDVYVCW